MTHTVKWPVPLPKLFVVFVFHVEMLSQATGGAADLLARGVGAAPVTRHGEMEGG